MSATDPGQLILADSPTLVAWLLLALLAAVILAPVLFAAAVPPAKRPSGPPRIYLKDPSVLICGQSSTGWSCRPAWMVTAFLSDNSRDDCTE